MGLVLNGVTHFCTPAQLDKRHKEAVSHTPTKKKPTKVSLTEMEMETREAISIETHCEFF